MIPTAGVVSPLGSSARPTSEFLRWYWLSRRVGTVLSSLLRVEGSSTGEKCVIISVSGELKGGRGAAQTSNPTTTYEPWQRRRNRTSSPEMALDPPMNMSLIIIGIETVEIDVHKIGFEIVSIRACELSQHAQSRSPPLTDIRKISVRVPG
jgi:hypothetical protein